MNIKDKIFYISIVLTTIALIAFGVCFALNLVSYVGVSVCGIVFVGLLYAFFQDKRHTKMAETKKEQEASGANVVKEENK